jgi:hypothetical protein
VLEFEKKVGVRAGGKEEDQLTYRNLSSCFYNLFDFGFGKTFDVNELLLRSHCQAIDSVDTSGLTEKGKVVC